MTSLVLGATGLVGGHIVKQLLEAGETPLALSRSPPNDSRSVKWMTADLAADMTTQLPPFDTLYCTAHSTLLAKSLPRLFNERLKRVVLFTSSSLVTKINSEIESERNGLQALAAGEQDTIKICEQNHVNWTVLRPTLIYDEGRDANVTQLARFIDRFGFFPLAGMGAGLRQPVHAEDLAIGALRAAASPAATNKIYAMPGRDTISYREMVGRIFDGLDKTRLVAPTPVWFWRVGFALARSRFPNANVAMGDRMAQDMVFDSEPAIRDFGWAPRAFRPQFRAQP